MEIEHGSSMMYNAFQDLPVDLWHEVLSHLQFDSSTIYKVCQLARSWHQVAIPHLYRHVELRDPSMMPQVLFLHTLEANPHFRPFVQTLKVGICPPKHEHGDFIYDLAETLGTLPNLACLELLLTNGTSHELYSVEGNGNTIMRRYWRGEVETLPLGDPTYPQLSSFRVDIPIGYTVHSILQSQTSLRTLELRYPSHSYQHEDIFRSPNLVKLALSGESNLTKLTTSFHPTHLLLDYPASTPLWPLRLRKPYLSLPSTDLLRSLEISTTLMEELQLRITQPEKVTFPSLRHLGIFTSERVDPRYYEEKKFLAMWWKNPAKRMVDLLVHFPHLESLTVTPEDIGSGDWADLILTDSDLFAQLMKCCPGLKLLLWRAHLGQTAGGRWLTGEDNRWLNGEGRRVAIDEAFVLNRWALA